MLTEERNELVTRTGPGTPCGELLRRYWQPVALSEELPPGGPPLPVRLLNEDLVLFRDDQGRPGLLYIHCWHRGADLSFGRVEDGGLRCIYHGWLYDVHGNCLDQPGEAPDSDFKNKIHLPSYPTIEKGGVIFAYLGPGEPPLLPNYPSLTAPEGYYSAGKLYSECNYMQGNEGNIDLLHTSFLHYIRRDLQSLPPAERQAAMERYAEPESLSGRGPSPGQESCDWEALPYGVRVCKIRQDGKSKYVRLGTFLLPNLTVTPGGTINWHVPIDDTHHWKYTLNFSSDGPMPANRRPDRDELAPAPSYKPVPNWSNRFLQDRESMKNLSYSGIAQKYFAAQDLCATEGAGKIQNRTEEHLAPSDAPIAASRNLLMKAIRDVQEGVDPPHVVRDPEQNHFPEITGTFGPIPMTQSWQDYCKELVAAGKAWQSRTAGAPA